MATSGETGEELGRVLKWLGRKRKQAIGLQLWRRLRKRGGFPLVQVWESACLEGNGGEEWEGSEHPSPSADGEQDWHKRGHISVE